MSRTLSVHSPSGELNRSVELPAEIFDVTVNVPLIHQVVVAQLAGARQGTHATKTRGQVRGGGRKPYRQKGTGRARQGSTRAPQFTGGGTVHGPQPRDYAQRTPKKMKAAALHGALSDRARGGRVHVVADLATGDAPSTKAALANLRGMVSSRHVLVVAERHDELTWKSLRNVPSVHLLDPGQLNTYDVLTSDDVVFTEGALAVYLARESARARRRAGDGAAAEPGEPGAEDLGDAVATLAKAPAPAAEPSTEPAGAASAAGETSMDDEEADQ